MKDSVTFSLEGINSFGFVGLGIQTKSETFGDSLKVILKLNRRTFKQFNNKLKQFTDRFCVDCLAYKPIVNVP